MKNKYENYENAENKPKMHRAPAYQDAWNDRPEYSRWLQPVAGDRSRAQCTNANHSSVRRHYTSINHTNSEVRVFGDQANNAQANLQRKIHWASMKLCAVFAEHSLAFLLADHLIPVLKQIAADEDAHLIWEGLRLGRKVVKTVIQDVIADGYIDALVENLNNGKFIVQIDDKTDINTNNLCCVIVKYVDFRSRKIVTALWEVFDTLDAYDDNNELSAERLYVLIRHSFLEKGVRLENISAFASDGASIMMGIHDSVASRFLRDNPNITIIKCPSHSMHLCAQYSLQRLPIQITQIISSINTFFSHSYKRSHELLRLQVLLNTDINKILKPVKTRWLSLEACIGRIVEQYRVLLHYFRDAAVEELPNADNILRFLNSSTNECYILFLNFILPQINRINKFFQRQDVILHKINSKLTEFFKMVAGLFLNANYVLQNTVANINPYNNEHVKPLNRINLGNAANRLLNEPPNPEFSDEDRFTVRSNCLLFLQELCSQLKQRFRNMENNVFAYLDALSPSNALSADFHENNMDCIEHLTQNFAHLIPNNNYLDNVIDEWHTFIFRHLPEELRNPEIEISHFWFELFYFEDDDHEFPLRNLAEFFLHILITPHSNADPERVWSEEKRVRTPLRNGLYTTTVNSVLLASWHMKLCGNCTRFQPTERMYRNYRQLTDPYLAVIDEENENESSENEE